jgi:pyrroline-5-carboxylate reductase
MLADMNTRIAFLGGGNMARAMIGGLLRAGAGPALIRVGEPVEAARAALQRDLAVTVTADNAAAVADADCVIVAVKPQEVARVLQVLQSTFTARRPLLVSICAGVRLGALQRWTGLPAIVRAMPNRPALLGAGVSALCASAATDGAARQLAEQVLKSCGEVVWVDDEAHMDVVTALSGSGPAYFFLLAEQLAAAATRLGLDAEAAKLLAAATLYGAGQMAHADRDMAAQRIAVTSKGGTTEAALAILMAEPVRLAVEAALEAAARRGAEMARLYS